MSVSDDERAGYESKTVGLWSIRSQKRVRAQWSRVYEIHLRGGEIAVVC